MAPDNIPINFSRYLQGFQLKSLIFTQSGDPESGPNSDAKMVTQKTGNDLKTIGFHSVFAHPGCRKGDHFWVTFWSLPGSPLSERLPFHSSEHPFAIWIQVGFYLVFKTGF